MLTHRQESNQRGASAVLIAASALFLIGMAAIATDVGAGFNERRNAQSAADTAVVGGALWSIISPAANPLQDAVDQAKAVTDSNTPQPLVQTDWDGCVDPGALAISSTNPALGLTGGSDCISWSHGFSTMRVKVPTQTTDTAFGGILGLTQLTTSAVAEASIAGLGTGGMIPSGALGNAGPGTEFCIKTGTGAANNESCGAPSTGDFQNFKPYFYMEIDPSSNPVSKCDPAESGGSPGPGLAPSISRAFAEGIDHYFGAAPALGAGIRENGSWCPGAVAGPPLPDQVDSAAGYTRQDITAGLVTGGNWDGSFAGRLARGPYMSTGGTWGSFDLLSNAFQIDNRPLWAYIDTGFGVHQDCDAIETLPNLPQFNSTTYAVPANSLGYTSITTWDEADELMRACLSNESGRLFDEDALLRSPRIASAPRFWQMATLPSNNCCYDIKDFVPVFIQGVWSQIGPQWICTGEVEFVAGSHCKHVPGMTGEMTVTAPGQQRLSSASAYILDCGHLSDAVCDDVQTSTGGTSTFIFDIELTK